jgi:hypothetical protein
MGFNIHILSVRNRSTNLAGHAALAASFNPHESASRAFRITPELGDDLRFGVHSTPAVNDVHKLGSPTYPVSVDAKIFRQMLFENPNQMYDVF